MKPHTLTITIRAEGPTSGARVLDVTCPGVDDDCCAYVECDQPGCDPADLDENDLIGHGVQHQIVDGSYSVPLPDCYLRCPGNGLDEAAEELAPGRCEFTATFNDDGDVDALTVIEPATT